MNLSDLRLPLALIFMVALAGPVAAFDYVGKVHACHDERVFKVIQRKFRHQVRHVPHLPDIEIQSFHRVHQHRFVPASKATHRGISRRFCMATARLSDGRRRSVWYSIETGQGFAGLLGDGVQFCVAGFDRWKVYNSWCRVLR